MILEKLPTDLSSALPRASEKILIDFKISPRVHYEYFRTLNWNCGVRTTGLVHEAGPRANSCHHFDIMTQLISLLFNSLQLWRLISSRLSLQRCLLAQLPPVLLRASMTQASAARSHRKKSVKEIHVETASKSLRWLNLELTLKLPL